MISNWINANQNFLALLVCAAAVLICYVFNFYRRRRNLGEICTLYCLFILWKTVMSRVERSSVIFFDFLWSYRAMFSGKPGMLSQIYLNIMLFVPFGLFTYNALTVKRKGIWTTILGMSLSVSIELMQLYFHRGTFELDDILNNTVGTIIGALIAYGIESLCERREKKNGKN